MSLEPVSPALASQGFRKMLGKLDRRLFPEQGVALTGVLQREIGQECSSLLDVGCGDQGALPERVPGLPFTVGVDLALPADDADLARHSEYRQVDIRSLSDHFESGQFECVVALDVIEHLTREESVQLLEAMERIASKRVIVFTPNGFLPQAPTQSNPHQEHRSGWTVDDLARRGYRVIGINGWRPLRGPYAEIRWRPRSFWLRFSALTEPFATGHPRSAFQLFGVKDVDR